MAQKQRLELIWIGKDEQPKLEPRILLEDPELSYHAKERVTENDIFDNRLIFGDNLLALKALEQEFTGKIKCIYIDPPYNTGNAFEHYDDGLEHSIWLNLMRHRLEILKKLLREDGVILVQIDKRESAYLKVLMDEIFGRENFITTICVRMSATSGFKIEHADKTIVKNAEYIHVYSRKLDITPAYEEAEYDSHYSYILKKLENGSYVMNNLIDEDLVVDELNLYKLPKNNKSLVKLYKLSENFKQFVFENRDIIGRTHTAPASANKNKEKLLELLEDEKKVIEFFSENGEKYYIKRVKNNLNQFIPISLKFNLVDSYDGYELKLSNILGDWWDDFYLDMGNVENEGGVYFKASKKTERLIFRILNMFTKPGDWVLDSFAGSGTTGAVAHKMGRKWIMIELGEHCHTHIIPRLKNVISGSDQTGISKFVNWKGGGGFRYYKLAPSLLKKDKFGNWIINPEYNAEMLAEAMCKHEGFTYNPDPEVFWKQGQSTENDFIFTTTQLVTQQMVEGIVEQMKENETLLICCKAYNVNVEDFPQVTIKKIPQAILNKCEFGRDDYSLKINELPMKEREPEQLELF